MTGMDAFQIWAPAGARWADWVRPVPFAAGCASHPLQAIGDFTIPDISYIAQPQDHVAVFVDLPGCDGIKEGLALAKMGFRPVPLYNGTTPQEGAMATVDTGGIGRALLWGAAELEKLTIPPNAPPAFLLDSNRTHQYKMNPSVFDNSWDLYSQDVPSAEYLLGSGIDIVLVRGDTIQRDLRKIFSPFQKKGITILFTDGYTPPQKVGVLRR